MKTVNGRTTIDGDDLIGSTGQGLGSIFTILEKRLDELLNLLTSTEDAKAVVINTLGLGSNATDRVTIKGIYKNPTVIAVTVPSITDPDIAIVAVDVSGAFSFAPAIGDAVIAIPENGLPTNCRLQGCYVSDTDQITICFGSEGGSVTGAAKNFSFLIHDLT